MDVVKRITDYVDAVPCKQIEGLDLDLSNMLCPDTESFNLTGIQTSQVYKTFGLIIDYCEESES